ncbi:MAG: hypothetical protein ACKO1J_12285 [Tagaea sp.]
MRFFESLAARWHVDIAPTRLLGACLAGLVALPLLAAGAFYAGLREERARLDAYAAAAKLYQGLQDAEVDFSLARRAGQAFLRTGAADERADLDALVARARGKVARLAGTAADPGGRARLRELDARLSDYAAFAARTFDAAGARRETAAELRRLGERIEADLALYATRFERGGLGGVAADVARARVAIAGADAESFGPDALAAAVAMPLGLALVAETGAPEALAIVRRIEGGIGRFLTRWRDLARLGPEDAAPLAVTGREITSLFEAGTDALAARLLALEADGRANAARADTLLAAAVAAALILGTATAAAAWRVFAAQRARAAKEKRRRRALEEALARLDAALRARQAAGTLEVKLRLPEPPQAPPAPAEPPRAPAPPAPRATPAPAAEPEADALIKMLMESLAPTSKP